MNHLPDELLGTIFRYAINDVSQLLTLQLVCKKFHRLSNNAYLWYYAYKIMYPTWAFNINYAHMKQPLIDWKYFMLKLSKQKSYILSNFQLESILSKSLVNRIRSYKIQEPFVSDIDPITNTGVIAVSKYCKYTRHKILFYSYPEYQLIRKFKLNFIIDDMFEWSCQIIGIQSLVVNGEKVRFFAVSLNQPRVTTDTDDEDDNQRDELQSLWKAILIYRLYDDGTTTCLAHLETSSLFLGRGSYFFHSVAAVADDDGGVMTKKWLQIISPDTLNDYDPKYTVFMLAYGLSLTRFAGYSQIIQFDIRVNEFLLDPSKTVYTWDEEDDKFIPAPPNNRTSPPIVVQDTIVTSPSPSPLYSSSSTASTTFSSLPTTDMDMTNHNAKVISTLYLGARVSCMIHFRYPHQLNHLICTGNFHRDELSVYDWRFGLNVGVFPKQQQQQDQRQSVQPWGFESGWAIHPPPSLHPLTNQEYLLYGPRLIVVGDCQDQFEIKVWDISQLLKAKWDPFDDNENPMAMTEEEENESEAAAQFYHDWWPRKTNRLKQVAMQGYLERVNHLPYTIPIHAVKRVHLLDAKVKYTAYINLHTWLYLLHEDGNLSIMDIESGDILATVNTGGIAEDVNVVGEKEIIITRKVELLRSLLP